MVQVVPPEVFYPFGWEEVAVYAGAGERRRQWHMWQRVTRRSLAAHLWNRKTARLRLHEGSVLHQLLHSFTVLPRDTTTSP